jgi:hypothetical protein
MYGNFACKSPIPVKKVQSPCDLFVKGDGVGEESENLARNASESSININP